MHVVRIIEFCARDGCADVLRELLVNSIERVSRAPGCLLCELLVCDHDGRRFVIYEVFESREHYKHALRLLPKRNIAEIAEITSSEPMRGYYRQAALFSPDVDEVGADLVG